MRSSSRRASSGSRYSSTYFIVASRPVLLFADLAEEVEDAPGLLGVDDVEGDAGVDEDVVARPGVGDAGEADAAAYAGEFDHAEAPFGVALLQLHHPAGDAQAHDST